MAPRKLKRDPDLIASVEPIGTFIDEELYELEAKLMQVAKETAENEVKRVLGMISKTHQDMLCADFVNSSPPIDLFSQISQIVEEEEPHQSVEKENEPESHENHTEHVEKEPESENRDEMDVDDAAHETSIPIVHSGQSSGRNTATEATLRELITPAGHVHTVPYPLYYRLEKPPRHPRIDEEVAFSTNGSPLNLNRMNKRAQALQGNLEPKVEPGTSV